MFLHSTNCVKSVPRMCTKCSSASIDIELDEIILIYCLIERTRHQGYPGTLSTKNIGVNNSTIKSVVADAMRLQLTKTDIEMKNDLFSLLFRFYTKKFIVFKSNVINYIDLKCQHANGNVLQLSQSLSTSFKMIS